MDCLYLDCLYCSSALPAFPYNHQFCSASCAIRSDEAQVFERVSGLWRCKTCGFVHSKDQRLFARAGDFHHFDCPHAAPFVAHQPIPPTTFGKSFAFDTAGWFSAQHATSELLEEIAKLPMPWRPVHMVGGYNVWSCAWCDVEAMDRVKRRLREDSIALHPDNGCLYYRSACYREFKR